MLSNLSQTIFSNFLLKNNEKYVIFLYFIFRFRFKLLKDEDRENLKKFQYKGSDNSYAYKYIHSPLADYLVTFLPKWVAYIFIIFLDQMSYYLLF